MKTTSRSITDIYSNNRKNDALYNAGMRNRNYMRHVFSKHHHYDNMIIIHPPYIRKSFYYKMKWKKKIFPSVAIRGCLLSVHGKALETNQYIQLSNKDKSDKTGILERSK